VNFKFFNLRMPIIDISIAIVNVVEFKGERPHREDE